jgi:hypothetical protein
MDDASSTCGDGTLQGRRDGFLGTELYPGTGDGETFRSGPNNRLRCLAQFPLNLEGWLSPLILEWRVW